MLFMGEEWGEKNPFYYFVSHTDPNLVEAVRKGRKKEFAAFHGDEEPPDPQSEETFNSAKLNWNFHEQVEHEAIWQFYKALIGIRKNSKAYKATERNTFRLLKWEAQSCLGLLKTGASSLLTFLNFSKEQVKLPITELPEGSFRLLLNSADKKWNGTGEQVPEKLANADSLSMPAYSAMVYENHA
jgi:maltooligosyltrehalose trehalohydrolase